MEIKKGDIIVFENNGKSVYGKIIEINCNEIFVHEVNVHLRGYYPKKSKFWVNENDIQCNLGNLN